MVGRSIRDAIENMVEDVRDSIEEQKRQATQTTRIYGHSTVGAPRRQYPPPDANSARPPAPGTQPPPPGSPPPPPGRAVEPSTAAQPTDDADDRLEIKVVPTHDGEALAEAVPATYEPTSSLPHFSKPVEQEPWKSRAKSDRRSAADAAEAADENPTAADLEPLHEAIEQAVGTVDPTPSIPDLEEQVEVARDLLEETKRDLRMARRDERRARRRSRDRRSRR